MRRRLRAVHALSTAVALSTTTLGCRSRDEGVHADPTKEAPPHEPRPARALVGRWISDRGRALKAVAPDDRTIEFRIVDASPDYGPGELRFSLTRRDDGELLVVDWYRPKPPAGKAYSAAGYADCLHAFRSFEDRPFLARWVDDDSLDVEMAWVKERFDKTGSTIDGCTDITVTRVEHARLERVP